MDAFPDKILVISARLMAGRDSFCSPVHNSDCRYRHCQVTVAVAAYMLYR
jgi:hypothetical protein